METAPSGSAELCKSLESWLECTDCGTYKEIVAVLVSLLCFSRNEYVTSTRDLHDVVAEIHQRIAPPGPRHVVQHGKKQCL